MKFNKTPTALTFSGWGFFILLALLLNPWACHKKAQVKPTEPPPVVEQKDDWPEATGKKTATPTSSKKGFMSASGTLIPTRSVGEFQEGSKILRKSPLSKEDQEEAQKIFRQIVSQQPNFVEAMVNLGYTYELAGNDGIALSHYQDALRKADKFLPACTRLASLMGKQGNSRKALEILSPCIQEAQQKGQQDTSVFGEGLIVQAQLKWEMGKQKETLSDLRKAFAILPDPTGGLILRADIHRVQREYEQAKRLYERVLDEKRLGNPAQVYNSLALCEWELKNYARAVSAWEKAQKIDPSYGDPFFHLGKIALENGDYLKAEQSLRKLLQINPNDIKARTLLGVSLRSQGNFPGAEAEYLKALNQGGKQPETLFNLAVLYHQFMKQPQKALTYYEQYTSADPEGAKSKEVVSLMADARKDASTPAAPETKSAPAGAPPAKATPEQKPAKTGKKN